MSKEIIADMFKKIEKDMELKKKYTEMFLTYYKEMEKVMADKLVEFGKTSGYSFTNEDLKAFTNEFLKKTGLNKELSPEELDKVAGGVGEAGLSGLGPAVAAINAYLGQSQSQTILFANMVNQQAQYASLAAETIKQQLSQLFPQS